MGEADDKPRRFFYDWVVVGMSGLVFAMVRGVNDAFGAFLVAFVEEFGWSRAAVATRPYVVRSSSAMASGVSGRTLRTASLRMLTVPGGASQGLVTYRARV
jgi:membrane protein required for beta-lactamase induction